MNRRDSLKSLSLLTGVTLSSGLTSGLLSSCAPTYDPGYRLKFFTPDQDELVAELVEMIIPATDTPGAKAVGVNQLIDAMMASWASEEERKMFSDGLVMLNKLADEKQRAFFVDLVADSRVETLREVEKESKKTKPISLNNSKC